MSQDDEVKWDRCHGGAQGSDRPATLLAEIFSAASWPLPPGKALDIACGKGGNALFLAARGFAVTGVDISAVALAEARRRAMARSLSVTWQQADLEEIQLPEARYDLIVNFNYLQRSLIPQMHSALKIGGHAIFETYLIDQKQTGHLKNPQYLLAHNELLKLFRGYRVLFYREGRFIEEGESSFRAGILARKVD